MYADEILKKTGGLFRVKVELSGAFPDDEAVRAELVNSRSGEPYYLMLRELKSRELTTYMATPDDKKFELLTDMLPECLIEHNLIKADEALLSNATAVDLVKDSGTLLVYVMQQWQASLPLVKRMRKESAEQPASSSGGGQ